LTFRAAGGTHRGRPPARPKSQDI